MANRRNYSWSLPGYTTYHAQNGSTSSDIVGDGILAQRSATDYTRRHRPPGFVAPTSYTMTEGLTKRANGVTQVTAPGYYSAQTGYLDWTPNGENMAIDLPGVPSVLPSDLLDKAITKLRLAIKSSDFNAAQALGEHRETAVFVERTLIQIAKSAREIRRGNFSQGLKVLTGKDGIARTMSDAILAFQYGVKPLCADIHGAVTRLDNLDRGVIGITKKASVSQRYQISNKTIEYGTGNRLIRGEVLFGAFCRADLQPSNSALITASQLGLTNPASLTWELLPFSFVLDWAYPLGDYFSQFDALLGWEVRGYSQSTLVKKRLTYSGVTISDGWQTWLNSWTASYQFTQVSRLALSSVPFAELPTLKDPFSKQHVLNGLALLSSVFRGVK